MTRQAAVVLAAGKGVRMRSRVPKVLHRICGKELVGLVVEAAREAGLAPIVLVVPPETQPFEDTLGDAVRYRVQAEPLGSGHALLQARDSLNGAENVVLLYGDVPLIAPDTLRSMIREHAHSEACVTLVTSTSASPDGLARVVRDSTGALTSLVEEAEADEATRAISEINVGVYSFRTSWLWPNLETLAPAAGGEIYLTDLVSLASKQGMPIASVQLTDSDEAIGINTRAQLSSAEGVLRRRIAEHWMEQGVSLPDPATTYIDANVKLGQDTVVLPNTHLMGESRIGADCQIGPNTIISDSTIGDGCRIVASTVESATLDEKVRVGPFSHVRPGTVLGRGVHIGNFAEVNRSKLGQDTRSAHFSYIGDADVGENVNIGAGTVTCNYDGEKKNATVIEDGAFIGSDSMLIAPVRIGARSKTGAGSVVTQDVPSDSQAYGVPAKVRPGKARDDSG